MKRVFEILLLFTTPKGEKQHENIQAMQVFLVPSIPWSGEKIHYPSSALVS